MNKRLISIKEIVQRYSITSYTINHYTNLGLLKVVSKKKNRRLYDEEEVGNRLGKIQELVAGGYPLLLISKKLNGEA